MWCGGVLLLLLACTHAASAAKYYVGKSGCSGSGPGSSSTPFCTISQGVSQIKAGDTLEIRNGTYQEQVEIEVSGTSSAPITLQAAPGHKPIIDGSNESIYEQGVITIDGYKHIVLSGLAVKNSPFYCIHISGSEYITVKNVAINGCKHGGLVFDQGCKHVKALNNDIQGTDKCGKSCGTHEAITISETEDFDVVGNYVHHGVKEGIDAKDGSTNGRVYNNHVAHMGQVGIYLNHCSYVDFFNNRVHDNGSSGFQLAVGDLAMGTNMTDCNRIYHNEIWGNAYNGIEFWVAGSGTMASNKIYNNVLHDNSHYGMQLSDSSKASGNIIRNNIISKNSMGGITGNAKNHNTISHNLFWSTGSTAGSNQVSGDPRFSDANNGNFKLKTGSPAIDKGFDMGLPKVGAPDIGRHEYGYTIPKKDSGTPPPKDSGPNPKKDSSTPPPPPPDQFVPHGDYFWPGRDSHGPNPNTVNPGTLEGSCACRAGQTSIQGGIWFMALLGLLLVIRRRR